MKTSPSWWWWWSCESERHMQRIRIISGRVTTHDTCRRQTPKVFVLICDNPARRHSDWGLWWSTPDAAAAAADDDVDDNVYILTNSDNHYHCRYHHRLWFQILIVSQPSLVQQVQCQISTPYNQIQYTHSMMMASNVVLGSWRGDRLSPRSPHLLDICMNYPRHQASWKWGKWGSNASLFLLWWA